MSLCVVKGTKINHRKDQTLEFTASDDDNFNKLTESVVADEESDFDDWDEEQPGCGDETDSHDSTGLQ
jgi:hypothetical protein